MTQPTGTGCVVRVWYVDGSGNWLVSDDSSPSFHHRRRHDRGQRLRQLPRVPARHWRSVKERDHQRDLRGHELEPCGGACPHARNRHAGGRLANDRFNARRRTFSGNLTVPQGGWYNIEVRALDGAGAVLGTSRGTNKWGVGMLILVIGQSNMSGRGQPPFTIATSDLAVNYSNAGRWEHLADPYDDESPSGAVDEDVSAGGSMIPGIANSLLQTFDLPIAFVPSAKGGSNLYSQWSYRNPSNHYDTTTLYGQSITKAQQVGGVELIIMHQGEADLSDGRTEANYEADFATMIGHYRQDLYSDIPIFICQLGTVGSGTDARATGIRNAQHDVDNGTSIFMGATAMELPRMDTWHYTTPALTVIGSRVANAIKYYYGQSTYYRGPSIDSARFSDANRNQVIVTLNHRGGTDITPTTGITGFMMLDNGAGVPIGSAVRYSPNAVLLTLSRSIAAGHP